jgi:hypothetical protein
MNLPTELVGLTVNLKKIKHSFTLNNGIEVPFTSYLVEDPAMEARFKELPNCRIKLPGRVYTQDYRLDRINIRINEEGLITEVFVG